MEAYLGEIRMFAGNYAPENWHLCDGTLLSVASYQQLFALLGTVYGGDGVTNFGLPDLRGRLPIGQGLGAALTERALGAKGGTETVSLAADNNPAHTHAFSVANVAATTPIAGPAVLFAQPAAGDVLYVPPGATGFGEHALDTLSVQNAGAGQPHDNIMPCGSVTFIINLAGLYPTQA